MAPKKAHGRGGGGQTMTGLYDGCKSRLGGYAHDLRSTVDSDCESSQARIPPRIRTEYDWWRGWWLYYYYSSPYSYRGCVPDSPRPKSGTH